VATQRKGLDTFRAFLLPAGSPQSGKRKPGTSAVLGITHSKQRGAKVYADIVAGNLRSRGLGLIIVAAFAMAQHYQRPMSESAGRYAFVVLRWMRENILRSGLLKLFNLGIILTE